MIVHGPLQGAWLSQDASGLGLDREGRMLSLSWQNRRSALPEHDYRYRGTVEAIDGDVVHLKVGAEDGDGTVLMPGEATVRLPAG